MKSKFNPLNAKAVTPTRPTPVAPPVYRPQPLPLVAQRKSALPPHRPAVLQPKVAPNTITARVVGPGNSVATPKAPSVYRPQPPPRVLQTKSISRPAPPSRPNGIIQRAVAPPDDPLKRPSFYSDEKQIAFNQNNLDPNAPFEVNVKKPDLPAHNAAMPHRMSYMDIRDSVLRYESGEDSKSDFVRWTDRFVDAGEDRIKELEDDIALEGKKGKTTRLERLEEQLVRVQKAQDKFITARRDYIKGDVSLEKFMKRINSFHANVPDLGPHLGVNNPVRERAHLRFREVKRGRRRERSLSPMSRRVAEMSPDRLSGIAVSPGGHYISTRGEEIAEKSLSKRAKALLAQHQKSIVSGFDPKADFS